MLKIEDITGAIHLVNRKYITHVQPPESLDLEGVKSILWVVSRSRNGTYGIYSKLTVEEMYHLINKHKCHTIKTILSMVSTRVRKS